MPRLLLLLVAFAPTAIAADPFAEHVAPLVAKHCAGCHGDRQPDADLDLTKATPADAKTWAAVHERLADGTMPPKGKPQPTAEERAKAVAALAVPKGGAKDGRALMRRLNRIEYQNTVRDLLGIDAELADLLPEDGIASGFDTVDLALDLSATLMERYLEAADVALRAALFPPALPKETWDKRIDVAAAAAAHKAKNPTGQPLYGHARVEADRIVLLNDPPLPRTVMERVPAAGRYRYRIHATVNARDRDNQIALRVYTGVIGGRRMELAGVHPVGREPGTVEFTVRLEKNEAIGLVASGVSKQYNLPAGYEGPGLEIFWVEVKGPLPEELDGRARVYGPIRPAAAKPADAPAIVAAFAARAFRRHTTAEEIAPFAALAEARLKRGGGLDDALRVALKAILCSPEFLYLRAAPGPLTDHALASRLSYFLWSTMPDDDLFRAAKAKRLTDPDGLRAEVERMLNHPKARAFTENFTGQWLGLRNLKATDPDAKLYPEFDPLLEHSLPRETWLVFEEMLKADRSILEFVKADWSVINNRLAVHYGIPRVQGQGFRVVKLPPGSHRGGVLTQASVLKVTANGTTTSPVLRGAWVLDRIMGKPAPPPPNDVPAVEPDVRGATTVRAQLAKHRSNAACASCHARIDPPGFALESFDVIGGWRDRYRVVPSATFKPSGTYDGKGVQFADGPKVVPADVLPDGQTFADIDGLKDALLADPDQIARNLAQKLVVYATGHAVEPGDRAAVEAIVAAAKAKNYGFRTLVHAVVASDAFRSK